MLKKIALFCLLPLFLAAQLSAGNLNGAPDDILRTIEKHGTFAGDRYNEFVGDSTLMLNDSSIWKVHPQDTVKVAAWGVNEIVHPRVRQSYYWIKREHKFELYNHNRNETVRVMLVRYPFNALSVVSIVDLELRGELKFENAKDEYGNVIYDSSGKPVLISYWETIYAKCAVLSDGTVWMINTNKSSFQPGKYVYVSANNTIDSFSYILIAGSERDAVWTETFRIL
jgi:hypothetical protein